MKKINPPNPYQLSNPIFITLLLLFTSAQQLTAQAKAPSQDSTCPSWHYREDKSAILYMKEDSNGDENGAGVSISITKLKLVNNVWRK